MEEKMSFEESMNRLENIVRSLERGDVTLEETLTLYKEGTSLIESCEKLLDQAEQTVRRLRKTESGEPEELPFDVEEE